MPANKTGMILRSIRFPSNKSQVELKPILRWDDGGQMTDAVALQSSQWHADQHEESIHLALRSILDPFHIKSFRIQPI
jgi:hypothetical protein